MPTGYTSAVADGTMTDFAAFAMQCARAFGATITMRDDPLSAQIPERFEASDYHQTELKLAKARLARLARMSPIEAQTECQALNALKLRNWAESCDRRAIQRARYQAMVEQAMAWTPPTSEHEGLKRFMIQQLSESIDFDCDGKYGPFYPTAMRWPEWLENQRQQTRMDIEYRNRHLRKDARIAEDRTSWVQALRGSLQ